VIPLRDANPVRRVPIVTIGLIAACVVAFAYELGTQSTGGDSALERLFRDFGLVPAELTATFSPGADQADVMYRELLTIFTSMFLHGGWLHLIGNMLFLYIFGDNVEDRLGHLRYLCFYLLCGVVAGLAQTVVNPTSGVPMVGASGAIAGVSGAYLLFFPTARVVTLVPVFIFLQLIEIPAVFFLAIWFVWQLLSGVATFGDRSGMGGVAFWAHIGGFLAGMTLGPALRRPETMSRGGTEASV
jgi:rhomboid family protein